MRHDPRTHPLMRLFELTSPARTTEDIFTAVSQPMPIGRIYGGQVLAQTILAAARTLPADRVPHSMHGYFLRAGDASQGLTLSVDRIHDGRSFSTRRTQAFQAGVPIFSMIASFQDEDPGLEHQESMPTGIPGPDEAPGIAASTLAHPLARRMLADQPVELRHIPSAIYLDVEGGRVPAQAVWMRVRDRLPDDPAIHRAAFAYLSDMTIQEPVLRAHGIAWATPGLKVASLDHAMWWHRFGRADEWVLYAQASPNARGGRGLATGRMFAQDGRLLASVAQEIMVRVPIEG